MNSISGQYRNCVTNAVRNMRDRKTNMRNLFSSNGVNKILWNFRFFHRSGEQRALTWSPVVQSSWEAFFPPHTTKRNQKCVKNIKLKINIQKSTQNRTREKVFFVRLFLGTKPNTNTKSNTTSYCNRASIGRFSFGIFAMCFSLVKFHKTWKMHIRSVVRTRAPVHAVRFQI